ncbi:MAG TPA: CNNM domain-containing protein [Rhodocyclaceae bacterium]|nr:CNNM domain-containing protein [Rhodocyclaceae bacterium]HNH34874.1 CNNM domain-containing protein [Rhodocyclaceae bacterium]
MDEIPLTALAVALILLLLFSAFFSLAETCMVAANRHRLRHAAAGGNRGARLALDLLGSMDKLLGVILLGSALINAAAATLVSVIAIELFGEEKWALGAGTLLVTFAILVFSEITPKIVGATHADRLAMVVPFLLWPMLRAVYPVVWFVNLFARGLLRLLGLQRALSAETPRMTTEELRSIVLESGSFIPRGHREILVNLFDLEDVTVEDVMSPRSEIEAIDIATPLDELRTKIATSYHTRLPVFEEEPGNVIGVLHLRRFLGSLLTGELDAQTVRENLVAPYFVPSSTSIYEQLRFFQENRQRIALVVDEYGELLGLVTLEDIIEEIVGKFTTTVPEQAGELAWGREGSTVVDGGRTLRQINRRLGLELPLSGPKTLNGLILEYLGDIPDSGLGLRLSGVRMEILQIEGRRVKRVRLFRPEDVESEAPR